MGLAQLKCFDPVKATLIELFNSETEGKTFVLKNGLNPCIFHGIGRRM